MKYLTATQDT